MGNGALFLLSSSSILSRLTPPPSLFGKALWTYARVSPELLRMTLLKSAGEVFTRLLAVQPQFFAPLVTGALSEQGRLMGELQLLSTYCDALRTHIKTASKTLVSLDLSYSAHIAPGALALFAKDTSALTRLSLLTCSHDRIADESLVAEFARNNPSLRGTLSSCCRYLTNTVTVVNLSYAKLSEETVVTLCRSCPRIESLTLKACFTCTL